MVSTTHLTIIAFLAITCGMIPGVNSQPYCTYIKEGTTYRRYCSTSTTANFNSYAPQVKINGTFNEVLSCNSRGSCVEPDPTKFSGGYVFRDGRHRVTLAIKEVTREMTELQCYRNGVAVTKTCLLFVYIIPRKPVCSDPQFVDGGKAFLVECVSEQTYPADPKPICGLHVTPTTASFQPENHTLTTSTVVSSEEYPGDYQITCRMVVKITGLEEDRYELSPFVRPPIPSPSSSDFSYSDPIMPMTLNATALYNPADSDSLVVFADGSEEIKINISVTSKPPPYIFSLSVSYDQDSASYISVSNETYSVTYSSSESNSTRGTIELTVKTSEVSYLRGKNFFKFTADNGVVGNANFEFLFTYVTYILPENPMCAVVELLANGDISSVKVMCETDNIFPQAECSFYRMKHDTEPVAIDSPITYKHNGSQENEQSLYFSECTVEIPLSELGEGTHGFQVYIYPEGMSGMDLVNATVPSTTVNLTLPRASHVCPSSLVEDYLCGKPTPCNCILQESGYPRGRAAWFSDGVNLNVTDLEVSYNPADPSVDFTCEGMSALGQSFGSRLHIDAATQCG